MATYLKADRFYYAHETKPAGYLELVDGRFGQWTENMPSAAQVLDYTGYQIAPGLVDTHIHGYAGHDVMDNSADGLRSISQHLPEAGVTSFLPTTLTASSQQLEDICATIADVSGSETGAKIQGIYFEGPYFTEKYKGAQNPSYMRNPSFEELERWQKAAKGLLRKIGLAPEREGTVEFIRKATASGVIVALGHSDASYEDAAQAVQAGASVWVHAYNGMSGLNHREPGMVGAVYNLGNTYAELICDGYHVSPVACQILLKQKGTEHVAMITDCMSAGGQPEGDYMLGELPVVVKGKTVRLKDGGNLAGSILKLKDGLKNVVDWGIATPEEAVHMATYVPAKSVGLEERCGQIKLDLPADFVVLKDDMSLVATYINGEKVWGE
ncbi:N-acetylglucosamine-6-phosphate deacetylase [Streptococcus tangpeifui]|uniref:N-acetylglucosamine-6-phosphate deacetylase n=1 Tax=Streptococcus tangpeifui TaxID=2709400 RepID=UPI0013EC2A2B|nr:N-acetylglucosamine-6-phosphate deacetylase [Streptococcus sp. ZJ1593]